MKTDDIKRMVTVILGMVPEDVIKEGIDSLLDTIEGAVKKSENEYDNIIVLPLCDLIRRALNVPDND